MKRTVAPAPHLRRAGLAIATTSLALIGFETLLPEPGAALSSHLCLLCGSLGGVSAILNILLFMPLGIGLALSGFPGKRAVISMCALSALVETAQLLIPGRDSTIGDVLTNTLGGALGFAIGRYAFILLRPSPRIAVALTIGWSAVWLAIQTTSAFGFSPTFPPTRYFGQIAPRLEDLEEFRGRVLRASIADVLVSDSEFKDSPRVRELLLGGATLTTTLLPSGATHDVAPIVRVADAREREIVLLAQSGEDLVFGVRTGAGVLRFRPLLFAVADVFQGASSADSGPGTDTVTVGARYSARELAVSKQTVGPTHERRIPITASLGWTMLMPFQWYIEGTNTELFLSAIWIACLLIPLGYWGVGITRVSEERDTTRIRAMAVSIALALLYLGLVVVPQSFGMTAAPLGAWLAALTGILLGAALAPPAKLTF